MRPLPPPSETELGSNAVESSQRPQVDAEDGILSDDRREESKGGGVGITQRTLSTGSGSLVGGPSRADSGLKPLPQSAATERETFASSRLGLLETFAS